MVTNLKFVAHSGFRISAVLYFRRGSFGLGSVRVNLGFVMVSLGLAMVRARAFRVSLGKVCEITNFGFSIDFSETRRKFFVSVTKNLYHFKFSCNLVRLQLESLLNYIDICNGLSKYTQGQTFRNF